MAEEILRKRKIEEVGGNEPQIRRQCRAAVTDSIPGEKLWPGAFKMQLRAAEEEALPLVRPCTDNLSYSQPLSVHVIHTAPTDECSSPNLMKARALYSTGVSSL